MLGVLLVHAVSAAQPTMPPLATAPGAPRPAKAEGALPATPQPLTGLPERPELDRLVLSDAWMKHLDAQERDRLQRGHVLSFIYSGLGAAFWATLAVTYQSERRDWAGTGALAAAAAANLAFLVAQAYTPDAHDSLNLLAFNGSMNLAFIAASGAALANSDRCAHDCSVLSGTLSAVLFAHALYQVAFRLLDPPIFVSRQYADYSQLSATERPGFALDLLRAQARRNRRDFYFTASLALISGAALLIVGSRLSGTEQTVAHIAGGIDLGAVAAGWIVSAFETPVSERLVAGEAPPQPTAF